MHPGPMNRGVEIDPRVADSDASLVTTQVRAGLVVRMAVLYDLLTAPGRRGRRARAGGRLMLSCRNGRRDSLDDPAPLVDPARGWTAGEVTVEDGIVTAWRRRRARPRASWSRRPSSTRTSTCARPDGRTRRRSRPGTAAAAAGGYCAIVAMPNTDPVVDSASVLRALVEQAREEAVVPTGFTAAISKGQRGEELTEMAELADAGAVASPTTAGRSSSAGLMRRALAYSAVADRPLALHCEEPTLSRGGRCTRAPSRPSSGSPAGPRSPRA